MISLTNDTIHRNKDPLSEGNQNIWSVAHDRKAIVRFGGGQSDLLICNDCDSKNDSSCSLPPGYNYQIDKCIAEERKFTVQEIEVFAV